MNQRGYIVDTSSDNISKLRMQKHSACSSCGKCAHSNDKKEIIVDVYNNVGAKVGDYVEVNMETVNVLKAAFIVYSIPLVALLIGTIGSYFALQLINIKNLEIISGIIGFLFMTIAFIWIRSNDDKFKNSNKYLPIIEKIVQTEAN